MTLRDRARPIVFVLVVVCSFLFARSAGAADREAAWEMFCGFVEHQERLELDSISLEASLAISRKQAAAEIFELLDGLWKNDAVERMFYLRSKNERDRTALDAQRWAQFRTRQEAVVEQYRAYCSVIDGNDDLEQLERWNRQYLEADCASRQLEIKIAEVDLEYARELVASVHELRASKVGTRQDVIATENDQRMAEQRLEDARARSARCP